MRKMICVEKLPDGTYEYTELTEKGYREVYSDAYENSGLWQEWEEITLDELMKMLG